MNNRQNTIWNYIKSTYFYYMKSYSLDLTTILKWLTCHTAKLSLQ